MPTDHIEKIHVGLDVIVLVGLQGNFSGNSFRTTISETEFVTNYHMPHGDCP